MRFIQTTLLCALTTSLMLAQVPASIATGPEVGSKIPDFSATDQNGTVQNQQTILGPQGAILVFFRSADW